MKRLFHLFTLSLFVVITQLSNATPPVQDFVYNIHIGAFVKANISDFDDIRPYGFIYAEEFDKSLLRIYMGDYDSEQEAKAVIAKVKAKGYTEAYISGRAVAKGKEAVVIQLASKAVDEKINWSRYAAAGILQVLLNNGDIKIVTGTFANVEQARQRLGTMKKLGFNDAFVKTVNDIYLHPITKFESGGSYRPSAALTVDMDAPSSNPQPLDKKPTTAPAKSNVPEDVPQSYDILVEKSPSSTFALPDIRVNVKRNSVFELQKDLKALKAYTGSLDGLYGKGSAAGYAAVLEQLPQMRKYQVLAKHWEPTAANTSENILQHYVNTLLDNTPAAMKGLETSKAPIAKAYRAYVLLRTNGDQKEINNLMNSAIKEAFANASSTSNVGFNYKAAYTYPSLDQLLQHLRHIQATSASDLAVPCWLFEQHPQAAAKAFGKAASMGDQAFKLAGCDRFLEWEELKLLETIATDLNPKNGTHPTRAAVNNSRRALLALSPSALNDKDAKAVEAWHNSMMKGLEKWATKDPLHQKLITPLRIAYFQSFVRLEDFYMDKGFKAKEARSLALSVLKTIVHEPLASYL